MVTKVFQPKNILHQHPRFAGLYLLPKIEQEAYLNDILVYQFWLVLVAMKPYTTMGKAFREPWLKIYQCRPTEWAIGLDILLTQPHLFPAGLRTQPKAEPSQFPELLITPSHYELEVLWSKYYMYYVSR